MFVMVAEAYRRVTKGSAGGPLRKCVFCRAGARRLAFGLSPCLAASIYLTVREKMDRFREGKYEKSTFTESKLFGVSAMLC